ncbi:MAG: hypothetical protein QM796_14605 [Chthoniobacteraceae bacterium]
MRTLVLILLATAGLALRAQAAPLYQWATFVGKPGGPGYHNGKGANAAFNVPEALATDQFGNVYVADVVNMVIRKITPGGRTTTIAGKPFSQGTQDGFGSEAHFNIPSGIAVNAAGEIYVADDTAIRKIALNGYVSTLAGDPNHRGGADGYRGQARFNALGGLALDDAGNLYIADVAGATIRMMTPDGAVVTLAGRNLQPGDRDGFRGDARFNLPQDVAVDSARNVYVADDYNRKIRKISVTGTVTTIAGGDGTGLAEEPRMHAGLITPTGLALDHQGNLYVADDLGQNIRVISKGGIVSTLAGGFSFFGGNVDGTGIDALFCAPTSIRIDQGDHIYVGDGGSSLIRKIRPDGEVTTFAGAIPQTGNVDGKGDEVRVASPLGVTMDPSGNIYVTDGNIYLFGVQSIDDGANPYPIRKIAPDGTVTSVNFQPPASPRGDLLGYPFGIAAGAGGELYAVLTSLHTIEKILPDGTSSILAGYPGDIGSADGKGEAAAFNLPMGITRDATGNLFVADTRNRTIRKVTPDGVVTTLAGQPAVAGAKDGSGQDALFSWPVGIAMDASGNLYVADTLNYAVRKVSPNGVVTTFAGKLRVPGERDGMGSDARFGFPVGVAVDPTGNIWVTDCSFAPFDPQSVLRITAIRPYFPESCTLRKITPDGRVTTMGGQPRAIGYNDGTGRAAQFDQPFGILAGPDGTIYVADTFNNRISTGTPLPGTASEVEAGP